MHKRFPRYPDDADYQTNAPSYYEDLGRKNHLIKILAKRVWEYDETLNMKLEEIEKILEEMIHKIGEGFNEEIYDLLISWVEDGTLDHIINVTLMNKKADITYVDSEVERLDQKDENITMKLTKINEKLNTDNIILKVGTTEEFQTIGSALEKATEFLPRYYNDNAQKITILLTSGFIMKEQVFVEGLNLSNITLTSEDEEVIISRQHLTNGVGNSSVLRYPAFLFDKASTSFKIDVLFNMDDTGKGEQRNGFYARNSSNIIFENGAGCKNAGGRGLHLGLGSRGTAPKTIFTGAGNIAVRVGNNSSLQAEGVDVSGSNVGLGVSQSRADVVSGIFDDCTLHGVSVNNQSIVNGRYSSFIDSTIEVRNNSHGYFDNSVINTDKQVTVYDGSVLALIDGDITASISCVASTFLGKRAVFKGNYEYSVTGSDNSDVSIPDSTFNRVHMVGSTRLNIQNASSTTEKNNFLEWSSSGNFINAVNSNVPNTYPVNEITSKGILFMNI